MIANMALDAAIRVISVVAPFNSVALRLEIVVVPEGMIAQPKLAGNPQGTLSVTVAVHSSVAPSSDGVSARLCDTTTVGTAGALPGIVRSLVAVLGPRLTEGMPHPMD